MSYIADFFGKIWDYISVLIMSSNNLLFDIIDIAVVTLIIYNIIKFMRQTRAEQLIKGIIVFIAVYCLAQLLDLRALSWILSLVYLNALVVIVVLFQPELRSILERLGRGSFKNLSNLSRSSGDDSDRYKSIEAICSACASMKKSKTGALIVIERETKLNEIVESGTIIDAAVSKNLLGNLFFKNSPLHDGAVIIRENKIYAASCILPLTQNMDIESAYGTRHRAGIGVSEISDAIVIIVSEETGMISVCFGGKIMPNLSEKGLLEFVEYKLNENDNGSTEKKFFRFFKRKKAGENDEKEK